MESLSTYGADLRLNMVNPDSNNAVVGQTDKAAWRTPRAPGPVHHIQTRT